MCLLGRNGTRCWESNWPNRPDWRRTAEQSEGGKTVGVDASVITAGEVTIGIFETFLISIQPTQRN